MKPAIQVENLSKLYHIGYAQQRHDTLRDTLVETLRGFKSRNTKDSSNELWALKDVSFEVQPGEVLGIIGRNGAGKSTLLKILSRITEPTSGRAAINGRVGSLLEVGTGFHPELTGRENIYLNGAILGMKKTETERKFDEIVDFAEIEKFLDTPVKRYSSGMYVRLAFAVAAHLEPEILLVDEVLAVGDLSFQKKCLGKMGNVSKEGRTILFVSHNLHSIETLCQKGICISNGQIAYYGTGYDTVSYYIEKNLPEQSRVRNIIDLPRRNGEGIKFRFTKIKLSSQHPDLKIWESLDFLVDFIAYTNLEEVNLSIEIWRLDGICMLTTDAEDDGLVLKLRENSPETIQISIPYPNLPPGQYLVRTVAREGSRKIIDWVDEALGFTILKIAGISPRVEERHLGTRPKGHWVLEKRC